MQQPLPQMPQLCLSPTEQQQQQCLAALQQVAPGSVFAPTSLQQLLAAAAAADAAGVAVHLLAGNTGAGIYPQQWQTAAAAACLLLRHVPELHTLTVKQPAKAVAGPFSARSNVGDCHSSCEDPVPSGGAWSGPSLLAGAGVTISRLLHALEEVAAAEAHAGRQQGAQNLGFLCAHISRIAGTLVRNAATLGGHLALARSQQLESDLLPMMIAAGGAE